MAPLPQIAAPNIRIPVQPLDHGAFAAFGTVIQNPEHSSTTGTVHHNVVLANQGSALKYIDVTHMTNYYSLAPSKKPARAVMNMFVCSPRQLKKMPAVQATSENESNESVNAFSVQVLERHPFTPQTFIPTGLSPDDISTKYLVVVAPTLSAASAKENKRPPPYPSHGPRQRRRSVTDIFSRARPSPFTNTNEPPSGSSLTGSGPAKPKGPGEPDLSQIKAFVANGSQSVTYGPGTWHAPMVVLGTKSIDFVVVQYANGVALEDCQEIAVQQDSAAEGLNVIIDEAVFDRTRQDRAKL